jgi:transcriptional regulator with XRE-family HTH domain
MCLLRRLLGFVISVPRRLPHQIKIGETMRMHRKAAELTQEKLAEKAGLHPVYLGQVERGEQAISVYALVRIAKALKVRVRDLVAEV